MEGSNSIKSTQMALFTFFAQTGVGVIMLPTALAKEVGHDAWIPVLITGVVTGVLGVFAVLLLKRYSDKAIYDINTFIFGKIIGSGLNFLLLVYLFATTVAGASLFIYFIRITLLQETPVWILAPFITLPSLYLVWQGLKPMGRFLELSLVNYFIILLFLVLLYKSYRFSFLMPVAEAGPSRILSGIKTGFLAFNGFELIAFFYPMISDRNKVMKWYITGIMSSTAFFIIIIGACTAIFGETLLKILTMPFFELSRVYNAPILERVDLYLIALWFIPMACSMRCYVFAAFDSLQRVLKLKKTKYLYFGYFAAMLVLSSIPRDINQVFAFVGLINMGGIGVALFLVLCLVLSFVRRKGVGTK